MGFSSGELFKDRIGRSDGGADRMSARAYIAALTVFIAGGLLGSACMASLTYNMKPNWMWIAGYFVLCGGGVFIAFASNNWMISALGYILVIVPTGATLGPYIHLFTLASVLKIALLTTGASVGVGVAGAIYPKSVAHWSGYLLTGLIVLILGDLSRAFMPAFGLPAVPPALWEWAGALLFSGFIFFDMNRAMRMDYTLDNAVDSAVALYLDILSLFIRLLEIFGTKSED